MDQVPLFGTVMALDANLKHTLSRLQGDEIFNFRLNKINRLKAIAAANFSGGSLVDDLIAYKRSDLRTKLEDWTRYKCHLVVSTLNHVSPRIFDALPLPEAW